jgi:hypothetical protein
MEWSDGAGKHQAGGSSKVAAAEDGRTPLLFTQNENPTMKWEYMTLLLPATGIVLGGKIDGQKFTDRLNQLGSEGWELVSVFDTNMIEGKTRDVIAVLKRPVQ